MVVEFQFLGFDDVRNRVLTCGHYLYSLNLLTLCFYSSDKKISVFSLCSMVLSQYFGPRNCHDLLVVFLFLKVISDGLFDLSTIWDLYHLSGVYEFFFLYSGALICMELDYGLPQLVY